MSDGRARPAEEEILVWDLPTRLFHWLLVLLVAAAYVTYRLNWMDWHALAGDAVLALVLFRILWGFFGSETTRFAAFLASPGVALRHLAGALSRRPETRIGHNPAGGWMILLLIALLLGETLSGIFVNNDVAVDGPLSRVTPAPMMNLITDLHLVFWYALLAAIVLHLLAILYYAAALRQDLVLPMITGRKRAPGAAPPHIAGAWRASWLFVCGAVAAAAVATFL